MNYEKRFPTLSIYFAGYFHQDWKYDYDWEGKEPDFQRLIRHTKAEGSLREITQIIKELEDFLALNLPENEMDKAFDTFGSFFYAPGRNIKYRHFAEKTLEILKESDNVQSLTRIA